MGTVEYGPCDVAYHIARLRAEGELLAGAADCDITGPAAGLYLLLWNRRDTSGLDVRGDAGILAAFREHFRVTWR